MSEWEAPQPLSVALPRVSARCLNFLLDWVLVSEDNDATRAGIQHSGYSDCRANTSALWDFLQSNWSESMPSGLDNLQHIVVLMMENRSFDHMLGGLKAVDP